MGRRLPSTVAAANLRDFARPPAGRIGKPTLSRAGLNSLPSPRAARSGSKGADWSMTTGRVAMEGCRGDRLPLSEVVADCVSRWFQDALKEARAGNMAMQVLVGQMYCSGYGVPRNVQKGKGWISKASQFRSSAWKVGDKHPGYNASDSDSDVLEDNTK